jgi:hypothetical protein
MYVSNVKIEKILLSMYVCTSNSLRLRFRGIYSTDDDMTSDSDSTNNKNDRQLVASAIKGLFMTFFTHFGSALKYFYSTVQWQKLGL